MPQAHQLERDNKLDPMRMIGSFKAPICIYENVAIYNLSSRLYKKSSFHITRLKISAPL